jgi:hypothetical protein
VRGIEERAEISFSPGIMSEFHGLALSWSRGASLGGLLKQIELAEGDILMLLNQTIDLLQQVTSAVGQVLDNKAIWTEATPVMTDGVVSEHSSASHNKKQEQHLLQQRQRLEHIRPLLSQASASLLHGIIVQSRTVPSMVTQVGNEVVPLDAEEDRDSQGLRAPETFASDI